MKTILFGLITLMTVGLMAAEPAKQDPVKSDRDGIQGTWKLTALEADGQQVPAEIVAALKLVFKGDTLTFTPGEPGFTNYKFALDPTAKPAGFTMTHADGANKGQTDQGIYLLDGDHLKICLGAGGKIPGEFTTKAGSRQAMYTLERVR